MSTPSNCSDLNRLAGMLDIPAENWSDEDLAAMFRHQLKASLANELLAGHWVDPAALAEAGKDACFGDVFSVPVNVGVLEAIKRYAKGVRPESALPANEQVRRALYFATLAIAWVHYGVKLTTLNDAELQAGWRWCLSRSWLIEPVRGWIVRAVAPVAGDPPKA